MAKPENTNSADPFDDPLEPQKSDRLILNDTFFAAARGAITVDGMDYSFLKPPYMNFEDHIRAKQKLKEAYTQREFLLLYRCSVLLGFLYQSIYLENVMSVGKSVSESLDEQNKSNLCSK